MYVREGVGKVLFLLCTKYKYTAWFFKRNHLGDGGKKSRAVAVIWLMEEGNREGLRLLSAKRQVCNFNCRRSTP